MTTVNAEIVAIGSELLLGQIVDTNSAWMAQRLAEIGVNLFYKTIVGDNAGRMREISPARCAMRLSGIGSRRKPNGAVRSWFMPSRRHVPA